MRVIAGQLKGRSFENPAGRRTHPMSEKMRGALFNVLGDISGSTVLDVFAGSGALSFEAISRGAQRATAIEIEKSAKKLIDRSSQQLGLGDQLRVIRANASSWSDNNSDLQFDLVLADPPYDDLQIKLVQKFVKHLAANGTFILTWPGRLIAPELVGLHQMAVKNYGDAQLVFYQRIG